MACEREDLIENGSKGTGRRTLLRDVLISSVRPAGAVGGGGMPAMEEVSFSFGSAEIAAADATGQFASRTVCGGSLETETDPPVLVDGGRK